MNFLIDFENVSDNAFIGLENLAEDDKIIIFYSEKSSKISISTHCKLEHSNVMKEYIAIKTGGKNALDFQLATYLGYLIAQDKTQEYVIVSNDTGFDFVTAFWQKKDIKIRKCSNLSMEHIKNIDDDIANVLDATIVDVPKVIALIKKYKTKQGINNALMKEFGSEKTGIIYKAIKPLISEKK